MHIHCYYSIVEGSLLQIAAGLSSLIPQFLTRKSHSALLCYVVHDFLPYSCFRILIVTLTRQNLIKFFIIQGHVKEDRVLE